MSRNPTVRHQRRRGVKGSHSLTIALFLVVAACGEPADTLGTTSTPSTTVATTSTSTRADGPEATLMGMALHDLLAEMSTFGPGHRFDTVLVQTSTDPSAGTGEQSGPARSLAAAERSAIEAAIQGLSDDIRWVDDAADWRTDDLTPVVPNSAIIGVGEVVFDAAGALIPVSLWCGGLCGTWFTWRAEQIDGDWEITGIEGPVAIS